MQDGQEGKTRINWPRLWGKPHRNTGAIPRIHGALPTAAAMYDVVVNECLRENARLIVYITPESDQNGRLYTLALQVKRIIPRARWRDTHTILMDHSHIYTIDAWVHGYWSERLSPNGWHELETTR